jgi:hypothetical protein
MSKANRSDDADLSRRSLLAAATAAAATFALPAVWLPRSARAAGNRAQFKRVPTQYIAALAAEKATSGSNAQTWGLWRQDPGPRGVALERYQLLKAADGVAPAGWKLDDGLWWLEEHGLIMEAPEFPLPPGSYLVTGGRSATAALTVHPKASDGTQHWELDSGATLYDVTHLHCRSARYTPSSSHGSCSPASARRTEFPVAAGAAMPSVDGCAKQDYAVLIVIGVAQQLV